MCHILDKCRFLWYNAIIENKKARQCTEAATSIHLRRRSRRRRNGITPHRRDSILFFTAPRKWELVISLCCYTCVISKDTVYGESLHSVFFRFP